LLSVVRDDRVGRDGAWSILFGFLFFVPLFGTLIGALSESGGAAPKTSLPEDATADI